MSETHKIARQILDIEARENTDSFALQTRIRDFYYEKILPILEQKFDELAPNGQTIIIDKLELDLGEEDLTHHLEHKLLEKFEALIEEIILPIKRGIESGDVSGTISKTLVNGHEEISEWKQVPKEQTLFEAFCIFMEKGYLPWGSVASDPNTDKNKTKLERVIDQLIELNFTSVVTYLIRNRSSIAIQQRGYHHFTSKHIEQFISYLLKTEFSISENDISILLEELSKLFTGNNRLVAENKQLLWSLFLTLSGQQSHKKKELFLPTVMRLIGLELGMNSGKLFFKLLDHIGKNQPSSYPKVEQYLNESTIDIVELQQLMQTEDILNEVEQASVEPPKVLSDWIRSKRDLSSFMNELNISQSTSEELWMEFIKKQLRANNEFVNEDSLKKGQSKNIEEQNNQGTSEPIEDLGIAVDNAGLVLLAFFIPFLFDHLGWLDEERNIKEEYLGKALSLTQFLVYGDEIVDESQLPLNKLILGIDLDEPIANSEVLSEEEQEHANGLVESAIQRWEAIGNTSVEGFRVSFLQREGILYENEDSYTLKVEKKTIDILMDRLPWSIGIVKLNWMPKILMVEW